ncbi:glutamine amidotransferase [Sulfuricella denitrificans skB26]|uniref:Glutamine amidotransferase n=1 Tax=Sulfuricella denitrificans (strain DSM 22764 / NBRC 105220 / skB26) TaxID=1163617 RepID=S6AZQ9_SULDS|nr:class II glutamine amidotransferase [Sulfuricella denitrificans]BAN33997.1 glutamine amidotransferase [Sulfuricella denitrificans skB26]
MCELFGMSASQAMTARGALCDFRLRGGLAADNPDGWGLAWWESGVFRLAKEPLPAHQSVPFALLCETTRSNLIVAHVRKARFPPVNTMDNTHPFQRVCCGKEWVFAHNGLVPDIVEIERANNSSVCHPTGETDSEYAFCHLLSHISQNILASPAANANFSFPIVAMISELIASHGQFNFLMSDGEHLIAYGHDRLHYLEQGGSDSLGGATADKVMIATEPLSGDGIWIAFEPGELRIYRLGKIVGQILTRPSSLIVDLEELPA